MNVNICLCHQVFWQFDKLGWTFCLSNWLWFICNPAATLNQSEKICKKRAQWFILTGGECNICHNSKCEDIFHCLVSSFHLENIICWQGQLCNTIIPVWCVSCLILLSDTDKSVSASLWSKCAAMIALIYLFIFLIEHNAG